MTLEEKKRIIDFYDKRYEEFGYHVKSVGWGDKESQELRFKILSEISDLSGCSICDVGCGFGDLYPYLLNNFGKIDYLGIDISKKIIVEAKERYPLAVFEVNDILENPARRKVDYVLSSGALSFKTQNHEQYVQRMLEAMMEMCEKGVAVNFLSGYVDYKLDKNFHFLPENALTLGKKITRYVTIRHDYPLYEFTLYLYHKPCQR